MKKSISDLSEKSKKMWGWLVSKPDKNTAKVPQFKKNFQDLHLEMAFLRMKDILPYSYQLSSKRLYEIFNAQTVYPFIHHLLCIKDKPQAYTTFTHDFRTVELARTMFEISSQYLQDSTNSQMIQNDLSRVSEHFKFVSENKLENETYASHGNDKTKTLTESEEQRLFLEKVELIDKYNKQHATENIQRLHKKYHELNLEKIKLESKIQFNKQSKSQPNKIIKKYQTEIDEIQKELANIDSKAIEKINNVEKRLETKHDHLSSYFCPKNFLPEFLKYVIEKRFAFPEPDDGTPLIIEPSRNLFDSFSMPESDLPKDRMITDEIREYYTSPSYFFSVLQNHDKVKWYGANPSIPLSKLRRYPPLNRFRPSGILSIIPTTEG